ncbi:twin-arginine translocase TatA/TatE family subunit [Candidatus Woesebacteria bacterium]|nr:twin-arginine translocase TatA/TatE family subunit [Candidatus Woesebacteria bacterium]
MPVNLGTPELIIIALIVILLFGGKKIPEFIKGIGQAMNEFKKGAKEE